MVRVLRNLGLGVLTVVTACLAAEVFLRLVTERETMQAMWFTPGAHVADKRFGFAFKPHYRGHAPSGRPARHVLNEYGLRQVNARAGAGR
jgi:hypothetical protein